MSKSIFLKICQIAALSMLVVFCGCAGTRFYVPRQVPIKPGTILKPEYNIVCSVNIINNQKSSKWVDIGDYTHKWSANLLMWTDTAVGLLKDEMGKRDVIISEKSPKTLKLSITRVKLFWGFNIVGCTLNLKVMTGDGYTVNLEETNSAKDLYGSCDGAVTKAVASMFKDHQIQEYLVSSKIVKDSDCDGVYDNCDQCPGTPEGVEVDDRGCPLDTDGDGVPDYCDQCPGTPEGVEVDGRGCPLDADGDGVQNYRDQCPGTPPGVRVDERGCWVIGDALFDFDKYIIKQQYYSVLDEAAAVLKKNPDLKIEIQGHTCNMGTEAYNKKLSGRRANAIMNYFIKKGIDETRLSALGYGLSKPKASNETEAGRILNRRVVLHPY